MTTKQIERVVHQEPFRPFRLVLTDGEELLVRRPRKSSVSGDQVALVGICRTNGKGLGVERLRIIKIERIASAEYVENGKVR